MKINPRDFMDSKALSNFNKPLKPATIKKLTAGKKILVPVGSALKTKNNHKILEVCSVVLKDLEKNGEEGCLFVDIFYLNEKSLWRIANWAIAMRVIDSFDPENEEDIKNLMLNGPFIGVLESNEYNGNTYLKLRYHNSCYCERDQDGDPVYTKDELVLINKGEKDWGSWLKNRKDNPDKYGQYIKNALPVSNDIGDAGDELPF